MLKEQLHRLGLNETEAAVYLAIMKHGRISPTQVAKSTQINRTTVYSTAKLLMSKGLITEDLGTRPTQLVALPPEELANLLKKQEEELIQKQAVANEVAEQLKKLAKHAEYSVPKITFVEDHRLKDYLYKRLPVWVESIMQNDPTKTWWVVQHPSHVEHYEDWIDYQWKHHAPPGLNVKGFTNQDAPAEQRIQGRHNSRRHIAYWEPAKGFTATTWICGNYLILGYMDKRPHYLVEIHDQAMAENFRVFFSGVWASLEEPSK